MSRVRLGFVLGVCLALGCGGRTRLEVGPQADAGSGPAPPRPSSTPTVPPPARPSAGPPAAGGRDGGAPPAETRFAVIGDYGLAGAALAQVAELIRDFEPDFVITTGDNNYPSGAADTIDANIGQYFHDFIAPYRGAFGAGADVNRFFPSLGNHDWGTPGAEPYLEYFELPHNERYYDVVQGNVHLFALDSDPHEPDGIDETSVQAAWLQQRLAAADAPWKVVYFHHPPYSSGLHGSSTALRWPFREWGASVVYSGHDHTYERVEVDGLTYVVNGVGGKSLYELGAPVSGSVIAFDDTYGAVLVTTGSELTSRFVAIDGRVLDEFQVNGP